MAKIYTLIGWEDGVVKTPAMANLSTGEVTPPEIEGGTLVCAENLNHMDNAIKELYDEGTTSKDIVIGNETEVTEDTKIFIDTGEVENLGSEVVDTLSGNEVNKSPSVRALKEVISICECGQTENTLVQSNDYADINISFTKQFSKAPIVIASIEMTSTNVEYTNVKPIIYSRTKTGAVIRLFNSSSASKQPRINWVAIGE